MLIVVLIAGLFGVGALGGLSSLIVGIDLGWFTGNPLLLVGILISILLCGIGGILSYGVARVIADLEVLKEQKVRSHNSLITSLQGIYNVLSTGKGI